MKFRSPRLIVLLNFSLKIDENDSKSLTLDINEIGDRLGVRPINASRAHQAIKQIIRAMDC